MTGHKLKYVQFFGREVPIVLQNENGPCPMLSIANVLLLRNAIRLPSNVYEIEQERLLAILAEYLLDTNPVESGSSYAANLRQNLQDAISTMHKLTTGIDVNPKFNSVKGFEFTNETALFDLFDIGLIHGWIIDPLDEVARVVGDMSYNQIVAKIVSILGASSLLRLPSFAKEEVSSPDINSQNGPVQFQFLIDDDWVRIEMKTGESTTVDETEEVKQWKTVRDWLRCNPSQLSTSGLFQLYEQLPEREIAVFFRNNHFNTIFKNNQALYLLVTDQGYIGESHLVWEKLESVNNDNQFCTGEFERYTGASERYQIGEADQDLNAALAASLSSEKPGATTASTLLPADFLTVSQQPAVHDSHDADMALAMQLQQEEDVGQTPTARWRDGYTGSTRTKHPSPVQQAQFPPMPRQTAEFPNIAGWGPRRPMDPAAGTQEMSISDGRQPQTSETLWGRMKKFVAEKSKMFGPRRLIYQE